MQPLLRKKKYCSKLSLALHMCESTWSFEHILVQLVLMLSRARKLQHQLLASGLQEVANPELRVMSSDVWSWYIEPCVVLTHMGNACTCKRNETLWVSTLQVHWFK